MTGEISVRRARPRDAEKMLGLINRARRGKPKMGRTQLLESFGDRGYMLAEVDDELHAVAGWYTEDFIARIHQVDVSPATLRGTVGRELVEAVCESAGELMCEVALLFLPADVSGRARRFYHSCGFQEATMDDLIPAWRVAAQQSMPEGSLVMVRKLREKRVMRPV